MSKALQKREELTPAQAGEMDEILSNIVLKGDISQLKPTEKVQYYNSICQRVGIDPMLQPFQLLKLQGKEVMYATKGATEQLRMIHGISVTAMTTQHIGDCYIVQVTVQNAKGRVDLGTGAVHINGLKGDQLANALMKAETKAKRRATLSICGLGMLDETEIETIPEAKPLPELNKVNDAPVETKQVRRVDDSPGRPREAGKTPAQAVHSSAENAKAPASPAPAPEGEINETRVSMTEWRDRAKELGKVEKFDAACKKELADRRVKKIDELAKQQQEAVLGKMRMLVESWIPSKKV